MKQYTVRVSPAAAQKIGEFGQYISEQSGFVEIAERWIDRVYEKIETLHYSPRRHVLAEENKFCDFEVRRQIIGNYLVIYAIDEEQKRVSVVGFRHGRRLPKAGDLPDSV